MEAEDLLKSEYSYRRYTTQDGLPSMKNERIQQDGKGFIWIAGSSGLTRYDGFSFKNYLSGKFANIYRLDKDDNGNIRAFSSRVMYTYDSKADSVTKIPLAADLWLTITSSNFLPDGYALFENKSGVAALYKIEDNKLVKVLENDYLDVYADKRQTFFDAEKRKLYLFNTDTITVIDNQKNITEYTGISAGAACKQENSIVFLAKDGIYRLTDEKVQVLIKQKLHLENVPVKMAFAADGTLFFNNDGLLLRFDGNKIDTVFSANYIKDFLIDNNNDIWIVTYEGLFKLSLNFKTYKTQKDNDLFRTVLFNSQSSTVVGGTLEGEIFEFGPNGIRPMAYPESKYQTAFFYDYSAEKAGALYFPGPGDVLKIGKTEKRWLNLEMYDTPRFVITLSDGNLMEGDGVSLIVFTPDGKVVSNISKEETKQSIYAKPYMDAKGRLWLGGREGITVLDYSENKIVKTLFEEDVKVVKYMNNDKNGKIYFASENRLFVVEDDTVNLKMNLPYLVQGIYFTRKNNTPVISTLGGIFIFNNDFEKQVFYNHENGYNGGESSSGSITEDEDGNIYLPSINGLVVFNPEKLIKSQSKPNLYILSASSSTDNVKWETANANFLKLNYKHDNIRFSYIGLSYSAAENVRYFYRLKGFQDEFSEPTKQREVTFNNLKPGDYTFEIYADAGTDESKSEIQTFSFSIQPAFWQTTWFLIILILSLVSLSSLLSLFFLQRKNRVLFEHLETEKQLNDLRIRSIRLKAIPHFNANVLAAIEYYIMNMSKTEALRLLGIYARFTFQTLREVDKASRSLNEELEYVKMYLELEKLRFVNKFDYKIEVEPTVDTDNVQLPNMILHTYCENAVKHGLSSKNGDGALNIKIIQSGDLVCVSVEDNGVGREAAARNKNVPSSKQGLDILSRQIEIYNRFNTTKINQKVDDLYADGQPSGTRFTVEVPYGFVYQ
jgi:ligand-binding sensor domain-containing protein